MTFINAEDGPQLLLLPAGHIIVSITVSESQGVSWSFSGGKEDAGEVFALQAEIVKGYPETNTLVMQGLHRLYDSEKM